MLERKQYYRSSWERRSWYVLGIVILMMCFIVTGVWMIEKNSNAEYVPPAFEENAEKLTDNMIEEYHIVPTETENGFSFAVSPEMKLYKNGRLTIGAANIASNEVFLQYIVSKADSDEVLFQTGVLKPGECIMDLYPENEIEIKEYKLKITVNAFEPDTWHSKGKLILNFTLENVEK